MRRAARTDGNQEDLVKALRAYGCSVSIISGAGVPGLPDLLIGINKRTGLIECKSSTEAKSKTRGMTEDQIKWWDGWKGGPVAIVADVDGALKFARMLAFGDANVG